MKNGSADDGIFGVKPNTRWLEAQHGIALTCRFFQAFGDSQVGVVSL
jgi:hypothetical protein